jgi:hypothetical protein
MGSRPGVLCLQDMTELEVNRQRACGPKPLSYEAQRGMHLYPTYAMTSTRQKP